MKKRVLSLTMAVLMLSMLIINVSAARYDNDYEAPILYGQQVRDNGDGTVDIRLVSIATSRKGTKMGCIVDASWYDEASKEQKTIPSVQIMEAQVWKRRCYTVF